MIVYVPVSPDNEYLGYLVSDIDELQARINLIAYRRQELVGTQNWSEFETLGWRIAAFTETKLTSEDCELLADILVQLSDSDDRHGYLAYAGQIDAIIAKLREGGV